MEYIGDKKFIRKVAITRTFYQVVRTGTPSFFERDMRHGKIASFETGKAVTEVVEAPRELTEIEETMLIQTRRNDEEADFEREET